ncbi:hypothetical protein [Acanthopleuribacter pedis]|uniref:Uncharacterized protein n=1 Tax=Acanthopleuribacter pedis TaxID=442870 RepID=A0A8J7U459_9BACT|nr:hypothetical protein [Acanthopleuribacter pedis]MBO1321153.1 hypothetical protein [Acanthopleuribacter pedis]
MEEPKSLAAQELFSWGEERVLKYLLEHDRPEWDMLRCHPAFTPKWVIYFLERHRALPGEAVADIYKNRELRGNYQVARAMVANRATPQGMAMNLVPRLRWGDLVKILRMPHLAGGVKLRIEKHMNEILPRMELGQKVALARQAPRALVRLLRMAEEPQVMRALLQNQYFTYEDALFLASYSGITPRILGVVAAHARWNQFKEVKRALLRNARTPRAAVLGLARGLTEHDLRQLMQDPGLPVYTRRIMVQLLSERYDPAKRATLRGKKPRN